VFAGAPGSNKHDGGVVLNDLHGGSEVIIAEHDHGSHGSTDSHTDHH